MEFSDDARKRVVFPGNRVRAMQSATSLSNSGKTADFDGLTGVLDRVTTLMTAAGTAAH